MSLLHSSTNCYSNKVYHNEELDTFEKAQARQVEEYVQELIKQQWLTDAKSVVTPVVSKAVISEPVSIKQKGDNLLRFTKSRAMERISA